MNADPFVGRQHELQRLRDAFDGAGEGRGSVALIAGEPGIGKTRLARELESYAAEHGSMVLWGHAYEAGGAPAYWPWVQALRSLIQATDNDELRGWLGNGASEITRIVPDLRERLSDLPEPEPVADPQSARFRLFDATITFLANAASSTPLVVVLDDVHWADKATLQLLEHAALELGPVNLLLIGIYRDVELGRQHPLAEALAGIGRAERFLTIDLPGLSKSDTGSYLRATTGTRPSAGTIDAIYLQTEGNAFFLQEVVALMPQEGTLTPAEVSVPPSVRAAIGRRLSTLSEQCNELLRTAAVVGREFSDSLLIRVSPSGTDAASDSLESALNIGVLEEMERPGEYRFTHALIQETLLNELRTSQRVRLHGRIAEALEDVDGDRAIEHAKLAMHFAESSTLSDDHAARAIRYSLLAGREADERFAWSEATQLYDQATSLFDDAPDLDADIDRAELYSSLARVAGKAGEHRVGWGAIMTAADEYRQRGDGIGIAGLCSREVALWGPSQSVAALLREASALIGDGSDIELGLLSRLTAALVTQPVRPFVTAEAERLVACLGRRAAAEDVDKAVTQDLLWVETMEALYRGDLPTVVENWKGTPGQASNGWTLVGRLDGVREAATAALQDPSTARAGWGTKTAQLLGVAMIRAEFDEFEHLLGIHESQGSYRFDLLRALHALERGDIDEAVRSLPDPASAADRPFILTQLLGMRCALLWLAGHHDDAAAEFQQTLDAAEESGYRNLRAGAGLMPSDVAMHIMPPSMFGVAAAHLANEEERAALEVIIRSQPGLTAGRMLWWPWCMQRVYGEWALVLGMDEDAERLFADALEWCERERCPIEAGRCHQGLAEVAIRSGNMAEALDRLDSAATLFDRHETRLYLDQVRERQEELRTSGGDAASYPDGLSEREVEVLGLVSRGLSSKEIGEHLGISPRTVDHHVESILHKAGLKNRAGAAAYAAAHGLLGAKQGSS